MQYPYGIAQHHRHHQARTTRSRVVTVLPPMPKMTPVGKPVIVPLA